MTEKRFMEMVLRAARLVGWLCYHTFDSRRSAPGFPDIVCVRRNRVIYRELKTDKGKASPAQQEWIDRLNEAGADVAVWRPASWDGLVLDLQAD